MKIAIVEPHLLRYGGIRRILELSNHLVRMGEDVTIYHPSGVPCEWMGGEAPTRPLDELFRGTHDVVLFNDPPDYRHVRRAKARLKVFYILCLYEREQLKRFNVKIFWIRKGRTLSLKRALQMPFLKLANATWLQTYLREELSMDSELLLGGVNHDMFHPIEVPRDGTQFRILWSGDPRARKGGETVVQAIERVRERHPEVVVDTYHGLDLPQEKMAAKYSSAALFVDAQWYAGWNNPVAEAMACGVPVVCTDIGGVADFALHERTALLVPVRDPELLARAITRMIDTPTLRDQLKSNALNKIGGFTWDRSALEMLKILRGGLDKVPD